MNGQNYNSPDPIILPNTNSSSPSLKKVACTLYPVS